MSRHFDATRETSLQESITFKTEKGSYTVVELTDEIMDQVGEVADDASLSVGESLSRQLAIFAGCDIAEFDGVNIRTKNAIIQHITGAVTDPLGNRAQRRSARR